MKVSISLFGSLDVVVSVVGPPVIIFTYFFNKSFFFALYSAKEALG
jgi:hypothetical protein